MTKSSYVHRPAAMTLTQALLSGLPFREYLSSSSGAYFYKNGDLYFSDHIPLLFGSLEGLTKNLNMHFSAREVLEGVYYNIFEDEILHPSFKEFYGLHRNIDENEARIAVQRFRTQLADDTRRGFRK